MKFKITAFLIIIIALILCGCKINSNINSNNKLQIVTTIFPAYDFAREIVGDCAEIKMLIKPGSEIHSFEPTPNDIKKINDCDVFIYVGGESDSWLDSVLAAIDNPDMKTIKLMDYCHNIEEEYSGGMQIRDAHNHDELEYEHNHEYDEHVWTSPVNSSEIVQGITDVLIDIDPYNIDVYTANCDRYIAELEQLDSDFKELVSTSKRKVVIFGDRFPLLHFAKEYNLDYYAAYPGCAAESEPNAKTVAFLIEKIKDEDIPVVFHIELSNEKMADVICEETNAKKLLFSSCHNVTAQQFEQGITYIEIMRDNLKSLRIALN